MSKIAELQSRIAAALVRIDAGIDDMGRDDNKELAGLADANAKLKEQVKELTDNLAQQEKDAKKLITVNAKLREANDALNKAGDAKQLKTELSALQDTRKSDLAELQTIMDDLKPLIEESA